MSDATENAKYYLDVAQDMVNSKAECIRGTLDEASGEAYSIACSIREIISELEGLSNSLENEESEVTTGEDEICDKIQEAIDELDDINTNPIYEKEAYKLKRFLEMFGFTAIIQVNGDTIGGRELMISAPLLPAEVVSTQEEFGVWFVKTFIDKKF